MIPLRKPFTVRPYDPDREDNRTEKQKKATQRNFRVFRLRSLWALAYVLTEPTRPMVQALIDFELQKFGALPQREHEQAQRAKRLKRRKDPPIEYPLDDVCF